MQLKTRRKPEIPQDLPNSVLPVGRFEEDTAYEMHHLTKQVLVEQKANNIQLRKSKLITVDLTGSVFKKAQVRDVYFERCNLANTKWQEGNMNRVEIIESRLTGFDIADGIMESVLFKNCKLNLANFRFAALKKVKFEDCDLQEADFLEAKLNDVDFECCNLTNVQFGNAKLKKVDFRTSNIRGIKIQAETLPGVTISADQVFDIVSVLGVKIG